MYRLASALLMCTVLCHAYAEPGWNAYGRISGGIAYIDNIAVEGKGSTHHLHAGGDWGTSMIGLEGAENLAGGYRAVFHLENGFSANDGRSDGLFNRYAVVGISHPDNGTLLIGRVMSLTDGEVWAMDPMGMQLMSVATLVHGRVWGPRSNAITYDSPEFAGFSFRLQTGLGTQPDNRKANRQFSATASYAWNKLTVKAVYEELRDASGRFTNLYNGSREYALGGSYTLGAWKLFAGHCNVVSDADPTADVNNPVAANSNRSQWIGANYQLNSTTTLIGGVYRSDVNKDGGHARLLTGGTNYYISPRTLFYLTVGAVSNHGNANFSVEAYGPRPSPGTRQHGGYTGMVHWF